MSTTQFFSKLSQNYIELLDDDEYYDVTIEVGEDSNVKIFRAHMNILCYRSPYIRRTWASNKKNNDGVLTHIKLPNISPEIFQIVLKYIYGGILSLNEKDTSEFLKVLIAADILCLKELIDHLQNYLIESDPEWIEQHFDITEQISSQSNNLLKLQQFCVDFITKSPEKIFQSTYFTSLPEMYLVQIIKRDDLQMKEVEIWEHILKWGIAQNPTLILDPDTWSDEDYKTMANTLQNCLPLIRFFSLSSKEFSQKVHPYKKLLNRQFYENILNSYLVPDIVPTYNISLPRNLKTDKIIDSKIVNLNIVSTISRWIDKVDFNNNFSPFRELYLPYKFELLLRGSRDGFTPKKFHELCDDKHNTITFIKIKGTDEIIGGYNPIVWSSSSSGSYGKTNSSFIFSFDNKDNFIKDATISYVKNMDHAIVYNDRSGPYFGGDIIMYSTTSESANYDNIRCYNNYYEGKISFQGDFYMEDYEVFQL